MKKRAIYAIVAIALAAVLIFYVYNMTGKAVQQFGTCIDSDGDDSYTRGTTKYSASNEVKTDYCLNKIKMREYFCFKGNYSIGAKRVYCQKACKDGACIK